MAAERINISLSEEVEARAQKIIDARGFSGLSDLLQALIREEYERRNPPVILSDSLGESKPSAQATDVADAIIPKNHTNPQTDSARKTPPNGESEKPPGGPSPIPPAPPV